MSQPTNPNSEPAKRMIIACEDDAVSAAYLKAAVRTLPNVGIKVFAKVGDALLAIQQDKPVLVIFDHHLQGCTGAEGLRHLRKTEWGAKVPVIVYSGADVEAESKSNGANGFLKKPATIDQLLGTIKPFIDKA